VVAEHHWQVVYRDARYEVSLDTANVEAGPGGGSLVWYQTRHSEPRDEAGRLWNRELIRSLLRCEPLSFKTVRITVHLDDGPVVAERGGKLADVRDEPWRPVGSPSVDEAAMSQACAVISRLPVD
jgi:hypothetical protein